MSRAARAEVLNDVKKYSSDIIASESRELQAQISPSLSIYIHICIYIYIYTHTHIEGKRKSEPQQGGFRSGRFLRRRRQHTYAYYVYIYIYIFTYTHMYTHMTHNITGPCVFRVSLGLPPCGKVESWLHPLFLRCSNSIFWRSSDEHPVKF